MPEPNLDTIAAELHAQIQAAPGAPTGAAAFPGGDAILQTALAKLKDLAVAELRALLVLFKQKIDQFEASGQATGQPPTATS